MLIERFLDNRNENTMILPKVSSEVGIFYQLLLEEISKRKNILCKKNKEINAKSIQIHMGRLINKYLKKSSKK